MKNYKIKIELLSETILGSGESVPGFVDLEILYDNCGLPYYKGKTLKGKLREEAFNIQRLLEIEKEVVEKIFGTENGGEISNITFSNAYVNENIRLILKSAIESEEDISKEEILKALTNIRSFTSIGDNGVAQKGSLRQMRTINKGLILEGSITALKELSEGEERLLALAVGSLKHIGLMCNRGKGQVNATLYNKNVNLTEEYIRNLREGM